MRTTIDRSMRGGEPANLGAPATDGEGITSPLGSAPAAPCPMLARAAGDGVRDRPIARYANS